MKKIVFFTGAGMSSESGLPTFRGRNGLWDTLDVEAIADRRSWYCGSRSDCNKRRQRVLDFCNSVRRQILACEPNDGHRSIAALERDFEVTVITQNGDDFHERAGSSRVIHLHGEALKNASTLHPYESYPIDRDDPDIIIGDKAPDGSQLRPYVIFFGEELDRRLWKQAEAAVREADMLVVIGSTLLVYPAADLPRLLGPECPIYIINPDEVALPEGMPHHCHHLCCGASEGMRLLCERLREEQAVQP